jgi:signal transduction histidine kinase
VNIILLNLISNALKFTPNAGKIEIYASQENGFVKIAVQDNGVGIAPENTENIFGKSRFTTEGTQKEKGTGFGLTLCRDFVQILGGRIYFESVLGKGTTFFVEIPSMDKTR